MIITNISRINVKLPVSIALIFIKNNADLDLEVNNAIVSFNAEPGMHIANATKQKYMEYDRQFRIKDARNGCTPWNQIDKELGILYIYSPSSAIGQQST